MSSDEPMLPWESDRSAQRKRAALTLGALAVVALLVVGGMLLLLNNGSDGTPTAGTSASIAPETSAPVISPRSSVASTPRPRTSSRAPTVGTSRTNAVLVCQSRPACPLPGDPGNALAAVNAYRTSHGRKAVSGSVSRAAQTCAVQNGDGSACPQSYFWEPVSGHNGKDVVTKIAAKSDGSSFLLDPQVKSVQIGWAYLPDSGGYECVIINVY